MEPNALVYVVGAETGPLKIGATGNLKQRLKELQMASAFTLTVHFSKAMGRFEAFTVEKAAHVALRAKRLRGEWFEVTLQEAKEAIEAAHRDLAAGNFQRAAERRVTQNDGLWRLYRNGEIAHAELEAGLAYRELRVVASRTGDSDESTRLTGGLTKLWGALDCLRMVDADIEPVASSIGLAMLKCVVVEGRNIHAFVHSGRQRARAVDELRPILAVISGHLDAREIAA